METLYETSNIQFLEDSDLIVINGGGTGFKALGKFVAFVEDFLMGMAYAGQDADHMGMG